MTTQQILELYYSAWRGEMPRAQCGEYPTVASEKMAVAFARMIERKSNNERDAEAAKGEPTVPYERSTPPAGMSRDDAVGIANHFEGRHVGLPPEWSVRAIQHAYALGRKEASDG